MIDELLKNQAVYVYAGSAAEAEAPRPARELLNDHWDDVALDTAKVLRCLEADLQPRARLRRAR